MPPAPPLRGRAIRSSARTTRRSPTPSARSSSREVWLQRVERWCQSGLSAAEFATEVGIDAGSFEAATCATAPLVGSQVVLSGAQLDHRHPDGRPFLFFNVTQRRITAKARCCGTRSSMELTGEPAIFMGPQGIRALEARRLRALSFQQ
jgi:hypothetical protein